jgi:ribosomal protein L32
MVKLRWPEWRNGRRTGLKNSLLAISALFIPLLVTPVKPLILKGFVHFWPFSRCPANVEVPTMKLAQNLAQTGMASASQRSPVCLSWMSEGITVGFPLSQFDFRDLLPFVQPMTAMSNDFKIQCPKCGQSIECPVEYLDQLVSCPTCQEQIVAHPISPTPLPTPAVTPFANPNLTRCKDCGNQVSKNAEICPHCGAKTKRTSSLAMLGAVVGAIFLVGLIGSLISEPSAPLQTRQASNPPVSQPSTTTPQSSLENFNFDTTYYEVVKVLGPPDKEISSTDVKLPNIVMGYGNTGWLVYMIYDDKTFDKGKTHYLGTITTEKVVHVSDSKYRPVLEALKDSLK